MPFTKHIIEPTHISQCPLPPGEPNELECLSNLTLANVIRQLSSLGQHAGRIFNDLSQDAIKVSERSQILSQRIEGLKLKCSQLDIQNEEVSLADFQTKKQFKSSVKIDQQVVSRKTMPDAIRLMYDLADPPPALDKLNPYRQDGKDCMKFYTDPEFFFNIWCNELIKDNETRKIEKKKRRTKGERAQVKSPQQIKLIDPNVQLQYEAHQHLQIQQKLQQKHQQLGLIPNQNNHVRNNQSMPPPQPFYPNEQPDDQLLPPPPLLLQQPTIPANNYQIYAESNNLNNGIRLNKLNVQQISVVKQNRQNHAQQQHHSQQPACNERPIFPPPPIPENSTKFSDLQQIQHQLIRKYDHNKPDSVSLNENLANGNLNDLPPPPSPPNYPLNNTSLATAISMTQAAITNLSIHQHKQTDLTDSAMFEMPLPPPPIELQDNHINHSNGNSNNHHINSGNAPLPPPPPLPPLVESDTASSSTSSLNNNNSSNTPVSNSNNGETKTETSRSYLDDINKRRYVLKPTQKEINGVSDPQQRKTNSIGNNSTNGTGEENIQPFVNNSDVAAIIDFIRKFRPHVCDSSDDEENSDWDE